MELDNGFGDAGPVHYFTLGADQWQDAEDWPPPGVDFQPWYLRSDGLLSQQKPDEEAPDRFIYDPAAPIDETLQMDCWAIAGEMGDRREIEAREDVLNYTSSRFEVDTELTGPITATLHISSSAVDTDFTVVLADVFPDGRVNKIQDGIMRTGFRDPDHIPQPMEPGQVYTLNIDLWASSYLVTKGHQLRVEISSSDFNRYDRNPNTGEPFGHSATIVTAEQTVHHRAAYPSHIVLPIKAQI